MFGESVELCFIVVELFCELQYLVCLFGDLRHQVPPFLTAPAAPRTVSAAVLLDQVVVQGRDGVVAGEELAEVVEGTEVGAGVGGGAGGVGDVAVVLLEHLSVGRL